MAGGGSGGLQRSGGGAAAAQAAMRVLNVAEKNKVAATVSQLLSNGRCRQSNSW